jgi:hypothetical protein
VSGLPEAAPDYMHDGNARRQAESMFVPLQRKIGANRGKSMVWLGFQLN